MNNTAIPSANGKKPLLTGWARALIIIIPFIACAGLAYAALVKLIPYSAFLSSDNDTAALARLTLQQFLTMAGMLLLVYLFTRFLDRVRFKSVGFTLKGYGQDIILGVLLGAMIMAAGFFILLAMGQITIAGCYFDPWKFALSVLLFTFVAVNEEVLLRGYVLNNLMQSFNKYVALVVSSVIFSLLHFLAPNFSFISFTNILLAGILLGVSYIYTRNLWFPIALHFSWNFFQGPVFGFSVSGNEFYTVITQVRPEDNLINGGVFGFEGSLLCSLFMVIAIIGTGWWFGRRAV